MRRFAIVLLVLVALVAAAVGVLLFAPPVGMAKDWVVKQVKETTGRDLSVNGALTLKLWPRVALRAEDVTLSNASGQSGDPLFATRVVEAETALWPLITGSRTIEQVRLEGPRLALTVDAQGKSNWDFGASPGAGGQSFSVGAISVAGGSASYRDARSGDALTAAAIDGTAKDAAAERIGEVTLKSGPVSYQADKGAAVAINAVNATASGLDRSAIASLALKGGEVTVKGAGDGAVATITSLDASAKALGADKAGETTLKAAALAVRPAGGAAPIELAEPQVSLKSIARAAPLDADVAFQWNKERVAGNIKVQSPGDLIDGKPSAGVAQLAAPKGRLSYDGTLAMTAGAVTGDGKASVTAPSLRALATWLGVTLPKAGAYGAANLAGTAKIEGKRIALADAQLALDSTKATGALAVDLGGARPLVSGTLAADRLDADGYLGIQAPKRGTAAVTRSGPSAAETATPPVDVKDALKIYMRAQLAALETRSPTEPNVTVEELAGAAPVTRSRGRAGEWSDETVDFGGLRAVDLDLSLSVAKLELGGFEVGAPDLKAALKDGALAVDAKNLAVEGGRVNGIVRIDAREAQPKFATTFKADSLDTLGLFDALGITGVIAGKSSVEAELNATGASQRRLAESLSGRVKAQMSKGEIVGYDFGSIWSWIFGSRQYDPNKRSPFDTLEADVALSNGVGRDSNMRVTGPVLGVTADGTTRLPTRELDMRARLNLAAWFRPIGLRIFGEWANPSFVPDWGGYTRSPTEVASPLEVLKSTDLKDPELASLVGQVLEKSTGTAGALPADVVTTLEGLKAKAEGQ
jgi:AsmA protein